MEEKEDSLLKELGLCSGGEQDSYHLKRISI